jgi:hypothetical protein
MDQNHEIMDKVLGEKTQLNHRAKGLLGTYSQTKMWHFVLFFFIIACKVQGLFGMWPFDFEQE